ncbi:hypothetical protein E2320_017516 [Naja naja]|nr:hypothetical protein E2320_017516 [Naja naja]
MEVSTDDWQSQQSAHGHSAAEYWKVWRWPGLEDSSWVVPGSTTLDILRTQFGEVSLQDSPMKEGGQSKTHGAVLGKPLRNSSPVGLSGPDVSQPLEHQELHSWHFYDMMAAPPGQTDLPGRQTSDPGSMQDWNYGEDHQDAGKTWSTPQGSLLQGRWGPPPIHATFDGNANHVAVFMGQIINHLDLYRKYYPTHWAMVVAITSMLEGEAGEWTACLHRKRSSAWADVGEFLETPRHRFDDSSWVQQVEDDLLAVKQHGQMVREYVQDFRRAARRIPTCPECMLVHLFMEGLDRELGQACLYRGLPA